MVVIIDGTVVKQFGNAANAYGYAATMMRKHHDVWVLSKQAAYKAGY